MCARGFLAALVLLPVVGACDHHAPLGEAALTLAGLDGAVVTDAGPSIAVARRHRALHNGIDSPYRGRTNPLPATAETARLGRLLYQRHCAACHGDGGRGDGVAGQVLRPPPSDLVATVDLPIAGDDYLLWSVAEGGARLGTAMPAFKSVLTEIDIWRILSFLRSL